MVTGCGRCLIVVGRHPMSGAVLEPPRAEPVTEPPVADISMLEDRIPPHWRQTRRTAGVVFVFGILYLWCTLRPLWHTDLWGHLSYGRHIATTNGLPTTEPLMTLSRGVPFVDTAWLSQLAGYTLYHHWGIAGLQGATALLIVGMTALLYHLLLTRTRSLGWTWFGVCTFLVLNWTHLGVIRPQLLGLACFVVLWTRMHARPRSRHDLWLVPVLMLLWANLHGSFVVGLGLLAAVWIGRGIDLVRRTGTLRSLWHDAVFRRALVILQLGGIATLINPYGLGLSLEVLQMSDNANLLALTEWQALNLRLLPGMIFAGSAALLILLYRCSPRRVSATEGLILLGLGFATLWSARFAIWWGPVAATLLALHGHATARRWWAWRAEAVESPKTGKWLVIVVGLVWIFFAYSPLGMKVLRDRDPDPTKALSNSTPLGVTNWLNENPPGGLVFNPYEWGDYLQYAGPTGMEVFLNSHAHLVPREVWLHYLQVMEQSAEWPEILDRYGVNTVILDKEYRESLIRRMKDDTAKWKIGWEDAQGVVFLRRKPV
jgi:hypothetical protein